MELTSLPFVQRDTLIADLTTNAACCLFTVKNFPLFKCSN